MLPCIFHSNCAYLCWCMKETTSYLPRKSLAILRNLRYSWEILENVEKRLCCLRTTFGGSSEIRLKVTVHLQIDNFLQILKITPVNFIKRRTEVNFPSADWLSCLRTQLTVFVGGVRLRSRKIFSALFSRNNFFTRRGTL